MKRLLALLALGGGLLAMAGLPAWAHDVKDPVCRMMVDSDTAKFHYKLGNKTFYFCSRQCETKFKTTPGKYEKLAGQLEKNDLHEYAVELKTDDAPVAGKPVQMEIAIRYADSKELVKEYELVHERLLHFIMTTDDLSWFEHQHPVRGEDGLFRLTWTFPRPGNYRLYADFTPADGDNQIKPLPLSVGGGPAKTLPLTPDAARVKQVGNLRFRLEVRPSALRMEKPALLTYTITDRSGRPVRDVQPYIGAMGHLLAISQDGKEFVHTHVLQTASQSVEPGRPHVTRAMISAKGPVFSFMLTTPTGGLYKTWAQFMRGNKVYTVPFTFAVQDLWGAGPGTVKAAPAGKLQRATVVIDGEFQPAQVTVKAGRPVQLTFVRKEKSGCGNVVQIPSLKLKRALKPGERTTVSFTPAKAGTVAFTCGMGMYRGQVLVR